MYIHIRYGIEKDSHILKLDDGFVCAVDVIEKIRELKSISHTVLQLLNEKNEILDDNYYIHKAQTFRVIRKPSRD